MCGIFSIYIETLANLIFKNRSRDYRKKTKIVKKFRQRTEALCDIYQEDMKYIVLYADVTLFMLTDQEIFHRKMKLKARITYNVLILHHLKSFYSQ